MSRIPALLLCSLLASVACDVAIVNLVDDDGGGGESTDSGGAVDSGRSDAPTQDARLTFDASYSTRDGMKCEGGPCACANGEDDDGDGLIDGFDPECTGPADDDERTFGTGLPGDEDAVCRDCFFDGNVMGRDDGCNYDPACLSDLGAVTTAEHCDEGCTVGKRCRDKCERRTPNGCDCFGCCTIRRPGAVSVAVLLTSSCAMDNLDDPQACIRCTPNPDCRNDCGPCELCPGQTLEDLPEMCGSSNGQPGYNCDQGEDLCDARKPCDEGAYCQLGCCLPLVL